MPIYEYACGKCEHEFEVEQRITDEPIKTCPKCRSRRVKKLISLTSFVLKGDGWFSDLYSSSKEDKDKGEKGDAADAVKKDDAKPEKKVEKKADKKGAKSDKKSGGKKGSPKAA